MRVVHKLLRDAGFAPAWIEERKDIDAEFDLARKTLVRAWDIYRPNGMSPNEIALERNIEEFCLKAAELNSRIRIYNLKAPASVFHRKLIEVDLVIQEIKLNVG